MSSEPTDEELIAFADSVLRGLDASFLDDDLLWETIAHHRDLWRDLYWVSRGDFPEAPAPRQPQ